MSEIHATQLTLTDRQLAAVMNSVQFVIVALRLHQDVQTEVDYYTALSNGWNACDSVPKPTWIEIHTMLSLALEDLTLEGFTRVPHVPVDSN